MTEQTRFSSFPDGVSRRRVLAYAGSLGAAMAAAACGGGGGLDPLSSQPQAGTGNTIGTGSVRIGLVLPLSAPGGVGAAAASIRNAADLAMSEFDNPDITVLVKDDAGDPNMARDMVQQAIAEGAELILGPFTAPSVQAATPVAKVSGSTDYAETMPSAPSSPANFSTSEWDSALWDSALWDTSDIKASYKTGWIGIGETGFSFAPQVQLTYAVTPLPRVELVAFDIAYEQGGLIV